MNQEELKSKIDECIKKSKEKLDEVPSNPVTKVVVAGGKKTWNWASNNPGDAALSTCAAIFTFDFINLVDSIDSIEDSYALYLPTDQQ